MRKYEIHLPLNYSDGELIEQEKIARVHEELLAVFGSFGVQQRRAWKYDGARYVEVMRIEAITTGGKVIKNVSQSSKSVSKNPSGKFDILITSHGIQTV